MHRLAGAIILVSGLIALALFSLQSTDTNPQSAIPEAADNIAHEATKQASLPDAEVQPVPHTGSAFLLSEGIKDVLDNIILSAQSTDIAEILALAEQHCFEQQLSEAGCEQFIGLLTAYLDYKIALQSLEIQQNTNKSDITALQNQLQALTSLRRAYFNNEQYAALFGSEQAYDEQALARRKIAMAEHLSKAQKQQQITQQLQSLPAAQKQAFQPTLDMLDLNELKQRYADRDIRLLEVENRYGVEAAERLAATWQRQNNFNEQVARIAPQYHELDSEAEKQQLLSGIFSGNQLRRAKAILKN